MTSQQTYTPSPQDAGLRLDRYLADSGAGLSREAVKRLVTGGDVLVNGKPARVSLILKGGESILVTIPDALPCDALPEDIPINVVYEDSSLLVVDKEAGMCVHPAAGIHSGTLVNALLYRIPNLSGINGVLRPGIVHRIDKDTSGLLVVAKTDAAHRAMAEQFAVHSIDRSYVAICHGVFAKAQGSVDAPIGRSKKDRKKMAVVEGGRNAVTHYEVTEQHAHWARVDCRLETGRTHQIRVHMAYLNHPVVGDPVYGRNLPLDQRHGGQLLHAASLGFEHPDTGKRVFFESPLPKRFIDFFDRESKRV